MIAQCLYNQGQQPHDSGARGHFRGSSHRESMTSAQPSRIMARETEAGWGRWGGTGAAGSRRVCGS